MSRILGIQLGAATVTARCECKYINPHYTDRSCCMVHGGRAPFLTERGLTQTPPWELWIHEVHRTKR